ncbi:hypothetical protein [Acuticoccus sp. MNP-M23]
MPLLPTQGRRGRKHVTDLREVLNAIRYMGPLRRRLAHVA